MMMNIHKTRKLLVLMVMLFSTYALAEQSESLLNFKFNHLTNILSTEQVVQPNASINSQSLNNQALKFEQFDATWTYPWQTKNMNIDLGVTLRHLSGINNSTENLGNNYFQEVLPLIHASALYAFDVKGLSAGIEGSHIGTNDRKVYDYRAKVSYEWRKGFGLQGGWQHQQFNLENVTDSVTGYEKNGPFIDFYLNF